MALQRYNNVDGDEHIVVERECEVLDSVAYDEHVLVEPS